RGVDKGRNRIVREPLAENHVGEDPVGALVRHTEGLREAALVSGAGHCGDGAKGAAVTAANYRLLIQLIGEPEAWPEAFEPGVGKRPGALAAIAGTGVDQRSGDSSGARVGRRGREVAP